MKSITESQIFALCQSGDDFPVDFDLAWKWIGYGKKSDAKESLLSKGFLERIDYLRIDPQLGTLAVPRSKESIKLTTECFKTWAMMAQTAKGAQVRLYFLECERKLKQLVFNAPQPQLKPIDLLNLDDRTQHLLEAMKYYIELGSIEVAWAEWNHPDNPLEGWASPAEVATLDDRLKRLTLPTLIALNFFYFNLHWTEDREFVLAALNEGDRTLAIEIEQSQSKIDRTQLAAAPTQKRLA